MTVSRVLVTVLVAIAPFVLGQIYPPLDEYTCVYSSAQCGPVSQSCWAPGHQWGSSSCAYCDGSNQGSYCKKWEGTSCPWLGTNAPCGLRKIGGTCSAPGGGNVGTCTGGYYGDPPASCSVPNCAVGGGPGHDGPGS